MDWQEWLDAADRYIQDDTSEPPEFPPTREIRYLLLLMKDIQRLYERSNKRGANTCREMYRVARKAFEL